MSNSYPYPYEPAPGVNPSATMPQHGQSPYPQPQSGYSNPAAPPYQGQPPSGAAPPYQGQPPSGAAPPYQGSPQGAPPQGMPPQAQGPPGGAGDAQINNGTVHVLFLSGTASNRYAVGEVGVYMYIYIT